MRPVVAKLVLLLPLVALLGGTAPAERPGELPAEELVFSAIDGSSWDADGVADGVWTWAEPLRLEQRLTCGDAEGCSLALAVAGDLEVAPGAGVESSGALRLAVEGELRLAPGSFLAARRGAVQIAAEGGIAIDGLVSASAGPSRGTARQATVSIASTGGPGYGIRLGEAATVISEGGALGGNTIQLAGCGIEVLGLVASVASGPGAAVTMRSCEGLEIDGRDLDPLSGQAGGRRRGRVEVRSGGGAPRIGLWAAQQVALDGAELRVGQGPESRIDVTADLGSLSWREGRGLVSRDSAPVATREDRAAPTEDGPPSRIRLSACAGFDLAGAAFDPQVELELVDACGPDEEEGREPLSGIAQEAYGSSSAAGRAAPACTPDVVLSSQTVSTIAEYVACNSVTAEDFHIVPRGYVTFRAGQLIVLRDGFSVEDFAQFFAILDPSLNQSPVAQDDAFTIDEDSGPLSGNVLADNGAGVDSDPDGDPLTVDTTPVSGPTSGMATLLANGDFTYTPNGDFAGVDMFEYEISDGNGGTDVGKVTITVDPVNDPPAVATNTGVTVAEGGMVAITTAELDEGDPDDSGTGLTWTVTSGPAHGQLELTTNPGVPIAGFSQDDLDNNRVKYVHDGSETTSDSYGFSLADGGEDGALPATGTFAITVTPVNDPPAVATNTGVTVAEGGMVAITTAELDEGDPDDSGTGLTWTVTSGPAHGQLELTTNPGVPIAGFSQDDLDNNRVKYVHDGSETTSDSYGFSLADGGEDGALPATGTFAITVTPVNDPPAITSNGGGAAVIVSVPENQTAVTNLQTLDPEGDTESGGGLTYGKTGGVDQALFSIDLDTGVLTFSAAPDFESPQDVAGGATAAGDNIYEVQVTVSDGGGATDVQDFQVTVTDALEPTAGQPFNAGLGSFADTKSLTLQFEAIVDASYPKALTQLINQAQVTADGPISVLSAPVTTTVERAPQVAAVFVNDTSWSGAFRTELQNRGVGDATLGYELPGGPANAEGKTQLDNLPWTGLDELSLRFTEDVDVELVDLQLQSISPIAVNGFSYNAGNFTATWMFAAPLGSNKIRTVADGSSGAPDGVRDAAGNQLLDGEWLDDVAAFSSGDGAEGGDFSFRFNVQPADVDGDGLNTAADTAAIQALVTTPIGPGYEIFLDLNGDGTIDAADQGLATAEEGSSQPAGEPIGTAASGWVPEATPPAPPGPGTALPPITVVKTDSLVVDVDGDGQADPGDTLRYDVTITNVSGGTATNLSFSDAGAFPNASLGKRGPAALPDSYQPMGVLMEPASTGLLANDFDIDGVTPPAGLTVISTSPVGMTLGTLAANADGSFTYTPPGMGSGVDTFNYTVVDGDLLVGTGQVMFVLNTPPTITTDPIAYTTAGNTQLKGGSGAMATAVAYVENPDNIPTKAGVTDAETPGSLTFSLDSGPSNGTATVSAAGNFLYTPNPGFVGSDSFNYEASDGIGMVTGTVNVTVTDTNGTVGGNQVIWYVENDAAPLGNGTSAAPFDTLKNAESMNVGAGASDVGDTIFVLEGNGTTMNQDAGLVLDSDQHLLGHAAATLVANGVTIQTPGPGGRPKIDHTSSGDGVELTDKSGVEIRNLEITGDVHGIDVAASSGTPTLVIDNNVLTGSAAGHGANVVATGTAAPEVEFSNNTVESADAAFRGANIDGSASSGALTVTDFSANAVNDTVGMVGTGIRVAGVTFDADTGTGGIQQVAGGDLEIGDSAGSLRTMGPGLVLSQVKGSLQFDSVDILNSGGPGLQLDNTGLLASDFSLTIDDGTPTSKIDTLDGSALDLDPATVSANFLSATTSTAGAGFAANAIRLVDLAGTVDIDGGSLAGATGTSFAISGGTVSVGYSGGISHTGSGAAVSVSGTHTGGTVTFDSGLISATAGTGLQFDDADGTYVFNGATTLNGGDAGIDVLNGSAGSFTFASTDITSPSGIAFNVADSTAAATYSGGTLSQANNFAAVNVADHSGGTIGFGGTINATNGTGLQFSNADGVYNVNTMTGSTTLGGGDAGIDILGGSAGTFTFGSSITITNPTGIAFQIDTSSAGDVAYNGTISQANAATAVKINGKTAGDVTFGGAITAATSTAAGIDLTANGGSTITYSGLLDIDTTTGTGFRVGAAGGIVQVTNAGNTVDTVGDGSLGLGVGVEIGSTIGALGVTFGTVNVGSSGKANSGILLVGTGAGGFSVTGGTIQNTTSRAFSAADVDGTVSIGASLQNDGGRSVEIFLGSAGTFTFSGAIDDDAQGINISSNNTGTPTFTFQGGLDIDTIAANTGFNASSGGTLAICADTNCDGSGAALANTVDTATGTAASIDDVTIGAPGVTFASITAGTAATGPTGSGIFLRNTGAGDFKVTGTTLITEADGPGISIDGGTGDHDIGVGSTVTIAERSNTGIFIDNAGGTIDFGATTIANPNGAAGYGIRVEDSSAAVTFASATISDTAVGTPGTYEATRGLPTNDGDGDGIFLKGNTGSFTLNGGTLSDIADNAVDIRNSTSTTLDGVTISDGADGNSFSTANSAIHWYQGSNLTVRNTMVLNVGDDAIAAPLVDDHGIRIQDVSGDLIIEDSVFDTATGYVFGNSAAASSNRAVELDNRGSFDLNVDVTGSTFKKYDFQGLNLRHIGGSLDVVIGGSGAGDPNTFDQINGAAINTGPAQQSATGNVHGLLVDDNDFTSVGIAVEVFSARGGPLNSNEGTHATIRNNTITGTISDAIRLVGFAAGTTLGNDADFRGKVTNNTITGVANFTFGAGNAFFVAAEDDADVDVEISGNPNIQGGATGASHFQGGITTQNQRDGDLDLVLKNNTFSNFPGAVNGFGAGFFGNDSSTVSSNTRTAVEFGGNDWGGIIGGFFDTLLFDAFGNTMDVEGYGGLPADGSALHAHISTLDTNLAAAFFVINTGPVTGNAATVITPTLPPLTP